MGRARDGAADSFIDMAHPAGIGRLAVADLLLDFDELRSLLGASLEAADATDSFLLAAGLNQVLEDHLHRDPYSLGKVELTLRQWGRVGRALAVGAAMARAVALRVRSMSRSERQLRVGQRELAEIVDLLAGAVLGGTADWPELGRRWRAVGARFASRELAHEVIRLPSCFRDLDQRPEDVERLAGLLADSLPPDQPIVVVGLRTSGSYLGPLLAAALRARAHPVSGLTLRPGSALLASEVSLLGRMARSGTRAVVVDDPPSSGRALARAIAALEAAGFSRGALTVAVATLDAGLPPALNGVDHVVLAYDRWAVHRAFEERSVWRTLARLLHGRELRGGVGLTGFARLPEGGYSPLPSKAPDGPAHVLALLDVTLMSAEPARPLADGQRRPRHHAEALYEVRVLTSVGARRLLVHASGCGLGYLGRQALAVADALGDRVPVHFGISDGVLFREWVEERPSYVPIDHSRAEELAQVIAGYVRDRALALPARRDKSLDLGGRNPVWQRAADALGEQYGRLRPVARWPLHRLSMRLLAAPQPAIVDADMEPCRWFLKPGADGRARTVKARADSVAYSNEDLACYDPVFDLASAEIGIRLELGEASSAALSVLRSGAIGASEERWLLYRLVRLDMARREIGEEWSAGMLSKVDFARRAAGVDAAREQTHAAYLAATLGPSPSGSEAVCAIDVDGVLESGRTGYSSTTPLGLRSLRALAAHGYRPVLATGRSLDDVRWRCATYGLPAAVAEYGCIAYVAEPERVVELLDDRQRAAMLELSRRLRAAAILVDPAFSGAVRAFRLDSAACRRALDPTATSALLAGLETEVTAVAGWSQTDFVPAGVDKRAGLEALFRLAGWSTRTPPLALAIGDSMTDLPMLGMARLGLAPSNGAEQLAGAGVAVVRGSHQRGLADAVARLIGHRPGTCHTCAPPSPSRDARLLLRVLGTPDTPLLARPWELLRLLAETFP